MMIRCAAGAVGAGVHSCRLFWSGMWGEEGGRRRAGGSFVTPTLPCKPTVCLFENVQIAQEVTGRLAVGFKTRPRSVKRR